MWIKGLAQSGGNYCLWRWQEQAWSPWHLADSQGFTRFCPNMSAKSCPPGQDFAVILDIGGFSEFFWGYIYGLIGGFSVAGKLSKCLPQSERINTSFWINGLERSHKIANFRPFYGRCHVGSGGVRSDDTRFSPSWAYIYVWWAQSWKWRLRYYVWKNSRKSRSSLFSNHAIQGILRCPPSLF